MRYFLNNLRPRPGFLRRAAFFTGGQVLVALAVWLVDGDGTPGDFGAALGLVGSGWALLVMLAAGIMGFMQMTGGFWAQEARVRTADFYQEGVRGNWSFMLEGLLSAGLVVLAGVMVLALGGATANNAIAFMPLSHNLMPRIFTAVEGDEALPENDFD